MVSKYRLESGQGTVEFAFVILILIPLVIVIIEFSWIGYQYIAFDYGYQISSWNVSITENEEEFSNSSPKYISGYYASSLIKNSMISSSPHLNENLLKINNASIKLWTEKKSNKYPAIRTYNYEIGDWSYNYETEGWYYRKMIINANVKYSIMPITFIGKQLFGQEIIINKKLKRERLNSRVNS